MSAANQGEAGALTRGMTGLSRSFYEVACQFTTQMAAGEKVQAISYPSAVVILTVACLEAYLNEFLSLRRLMEPDKWGSPSSRLSRRLEERWLEAPRIFSGNTFDKGREPFQSFHSLVCLRNNLIHYDAQFRTRKEFPSGVIKQLKSKFAFAYEGNADWTSQVLNLECSRWACRTTKAMVKRFHEFVGGVDLSNFPYPWPDPL
jgi:hypothetical protein